MSVNPNIDLPVAGSTPGPWAARALCATSTVDFFPARNQHAEIARAKSICARCPVADACLDFGMGEDYGIWGGKTEDERAAIKAAKV